jgi:hypothetical protein
VDTVGFSGKNGYCFHNVNLSFGMTQTSVCAT